MRKGAERGRLNQVDVAEREPLARVPGNALALCANWRMACRQGGRPLRAFLHR